MGHISYHPLFPILKRIKVLHNQIHFLCIDHEDGTSYNYDQLFSVSD